MTTFQPCSKPLEPVQIGKQPDEKKDATIASSPSPLAPIVRVSAGNGFVTTVCNAYNHHHRLILRPDDVWLAIMVQFSAFMEMNGEELRDKFVSHTGQKELTVEADGTLKTANYEGLALCMSQQIAQHIKDPSLREWVMPGFSTTTTTDSVVGAITLMASMKKYFSYKFELCCGIPEVTLEGTLEDWKSIEVRARRLLEFDNQKQLMSKWYKLLSPVLAEFTQSFAGQADLQFWNRVCSRFGGGSGPSFLSGWITVFCVFDDSGHWVGDDKSKPSNWDRNSRYQDVDPEWAPEGWPLINTHDIPSGSCKVDVTVNDNGQEHQCELRAGHRAMYVPSADTVRPGLEWVLLPKVERKVPKNPWDAVEDSD